jgi:hypothetical protein
VILAEKVSPAVTCLACSQRESGSSLRRNTECNSGFSVISPSLHGYAWTALDLDYDRFLPHPLQLIIQESSYRSTLCSLSMGFTSFPKI